MENFRRASSAQSRTALLDAAEQVFAERGFEATSIRDVTDQAGVAHGLVRHYFASKEGLWRAMIDRAIDRYAAAMTPHAARAAANTADPLAATRAAARGFLEVSMRHPRVVRLMLHESIGGGSRLDFLLSRYLQVAATMAPLFKAAQDDGYLRGFDQASMFLFMLTAGAAPFALPALSAGVLGARLEPDTGDAERHINRILDTLLGPAPDQSGR
ncbi:TetR/AcrR family transcriptional regulator [Nonomuraea basaltis]|uniref:TetR/AcrR family transcriptional regulator n=1 Tax=Nonomuraea basaltis TaxID=2495887 RepID=UPI0014866A35|nr:TetR/AcrR family transcriptional regulator [Nonomuraea basaltis]